MATCAELATRLSQAESALHKLVCGGQTVEIQDGEDRLKYTPADTKALERYIASTKLTMARMRCSGCGTGSRVLGVIPVDNNS